MWILLLFGLIPSEIGGHAANRTQVFSLRTRCSTTELAARKWSGHRGVEPRGLPLLTMDS